MTGLRLSERVQGIGFSKIREMMSKVEEAKRKGIEITDLSIGRPDFDTPDHIKQAAMKAIAEGKVHYTTSAGTLELREDICRRYQEDFGMPIDPADIIVTVGAAEAIFIGLLSVLNPGDEVLVPEPMYVYYPGYAAMGGAKCVPVPLKEENQFRLKAEEVEKYITPKTKAIIINSPHNPTGQAFLREDLEPMADLARRHNLLVVEDDIYTGMLYDGVEHFPIAQAPGMRERTLIISSFSKTYAMDGWRIGYLISPREVVPQALKLQQHIVSCPNTFVQTGARAALTGSQDCVRRMTAEFDRRRKRLMSLLDSMGIPHVRPRGAFYIFPSIKKFGLSSSQFAEFLLEKARTAVVPGNAFGPLGEGYVRISYCAPVEEIEMGMERVRSALATL